ncbi:uncharacterized protein LOC133859427 isoform X2 [Alnus glutinosa]|uniref:uncharacterized protein LOC133859427 isoform X2 n=1 Tax=Alnus glutinosa TaxID=3517 RepID=UPI002D777C9E|nr:uncharacterized protein LOC133859427 isoform X2 [Alnus glutinosa]
MRGLRFLGSTTRLFFSSSSSSSSSSSVNNKSSNVSDDEGVYDEDDGVDYDDEFERDDLADFRGLVLDISYVQANQCCLLEACYLFGIHGKAINKPAAVLHWLNHANIDAKYFVVILDADMIFRGPITPWEFSAERGRPVSTPIREI